MRLLDFLKSLFQPAVLRCDICGQRHDTADSLEADYPSGATCADPAKCKAPSR